ncbi:MAG: hypothetical protein HY280_02530 [Nitrospinae bacterium]|nr:hypothetical protein [Nitrospinota bacterium]
MGKILLAFFLVVFTTAPVFAVQVAPRISDREIIDKLSALDAKIDKGIANLDAKIDKGIANLDAKIDKEIANVRGDIKRLEAGQTAIDKRFDDMNRRIDDVKWMLGLFITIALILLGFVLNMQWQMQRKQTQMETTLETQKDELAFIKSLIEKLLPPRGLL